MELAKFPCKLRRLSSETDRGEGTMKEKDGNPQASGTVRLQDSLNTVLLRDGGMNDAYTCETQRNDAFPRWRKIVLMAGGETVPQTVIYLGLNS